MVFFKKHVIFIAAVAAIGIGWYRFSIRTIDQVESPRCQEQDYAIVATLQSGESGTIRLASNHCETPLPSGSPILSFLIDADGALVNSISDTRLYLWKRNESMGIEQQIASIIANRTKKRDCRIEKNPYQQHDGLDTYGSIATSERNECFVFGKGGEFFSELFMETNGLIILQRQEGIEGIEPYNLHSMRFSEEIPVLKQAG